MKFTMFLFVSLMLWGILSGCDSQALSYPVYDSELKRIIENQNLLLEEIVDSLRVLRKNCDK